MYKIKKIISGCLLVSCVSMSVQAWRPQWFDDWYVQQDYIRWDQLAVGATVGGVLGGAATGLGFYLYNKFLNEELVPEGLDGGELSGDQEITDQSFDDFIGYPKVVERMKGFVTSVNNTEAHNDFGAPRFRGLLIEGVKKMGKTMLARIFAKEIGALLVEVSEKDLCHQGDVESGFKNLFEMLKEQSKQERMVLLVHDFSFVINQKDLLTDLFEGLGQEHDLIVIGEMRPQFDMFCGCKIPIDDDFLRILGMERVAIELPKVEGQKEILKHCLSQYEIDPSLLEDELLDRFARSFEGTFCVIKALIDCTARRAVDRGDGIITLDHLNEMLFTTFGGLSVTVSQTEEEKRRIAIHEAGHAIAIIYSGDDVTCVSVDPHERFMGVTRCMKDATEHHSGIVEFKQAIMTFLAGPCAEKLFYGSHDAGAYSDLSCAENILINMVHKFGMGKGRCEFALSDMLLSKQRKVLFDDECLDLLNECKEATMALLNNKRDLIEALADALMKSQEGTLYTDEVYAITGEPFDETSALFSQQ